MSLDQVTAAKCRIGIHNIIESQAIKGRRAKEINVWNFILATEMVDGTRFLCSVPNGRPYVVIALTGKIYYIAAPGHGSADLYAYLHQRYGIHERDPLMPGIIGSMRSYVITYGVHVELRRFAAYSRTAQAAYLSSYDGRMWRLDGVNPPEKVPAGSEEVFFLNDDSGCGCEPDIGPHGLLLDRLTDLNFAASGQSGITPEQQRRAMIIWMFALGLPDLFPSKPILMVEGTQGSGKSAAVQLLQLALMGVTRPMILDRNKESDFGVQLLRAPIAIFDNTDSYIDWVPDAICAYTTNGVWTKRALYTDDEDLTLKPHAFIAIASKNPASFRREDVADRCLILRLERRDGFRPMGALMNDIIRDRPRLLGEYLYLLNQIVGDLRVNGIATDDENLRMADFAGLGRSVGRVLGWPETEVAEIMEALQNERDAFINEEDPLVDLLHGWVHQIVGTKRNAGQEYSLSALFTALEAVADTKKVVFYKTSRLLAQKLRSTHIDREFIVEVRVAHGQKFYKIWDRSRLRPVSVEAPILTFTPPSEPNPFAGIESPDGPQP